MKRLSLTILTGLILAQGSLPVLSLQPAEPAHEASNILVAMEDVMLDDKPGDNSKVPLEAHIYHSYTGRKYLLGPNDILNIKVYDTEEFDHENVLVQPDGNIVMAPFGSIDVAGKTIDELRTNLEDRMKYYLNDPHVAVQLVHSKPFTVYVSGAVLKPGSYELVTDVARNQMLADQTPEVLVERKTPLLSNVLVAAGGIQHDADLEHVKISNSIDGSSHEVNLLELITKGDTANDLYLIAGDSIHVPRLSTPYAVKDEHYNALLGSTVFQKSIPVKVYGYVSTPGLVRLDAAQSANLNSAIVSAGGYQATQGSHPPDKVFVSRIGENGQMVTRTVDPQREDMVLHPNDIVYVPNKSRSEAGKAFDYASRIIMPIAGIASSFNNWSLMFNPTRFQTNITP